jgi:perosamine synthetase
LVDTSIHSRSQMKIPFARPFFGPEEEEAAVAAIRSGWVSQGPRVAEFERAVADYVGAGQAVATSSCTSALHLALVALGIGPGDEVILPSLTFIATANVLLYVGAKPVFVDVDPRTFNIAPEGVEAAITPQTRAIMPVHQIGLAADMDPILEIARAHGLEVIEDAAPALGATYKGRRIGAIGRLTCFSFHPRKSITTGEGGMVTTDDEDLAQRMRALRTHGMSVPAEVRHRVDRVIIEEYVEVGYNYRLTDIQAAIGIEQMKRLDGLLERRIALARRYSRLLSQVQGIVTPFEPDYGRHTFQSYMILLEGPWPRDAVMQQLLDRGISTRRGVMAVHLEPCYRGDFGHLSLPVTSHVARQGLILPLYPQMTEAEQDYVIEALIDTCRQ